MADQHTNIARRKPMTVLVGVRVKVAAPSLLQAQRRAQQALGRVLSEHAPHLEPIIDRRVKRYRHTCQAHLSSRFRRGVPICGKQFFAAHVRTSGGFEPKYCSGACARREFLYQFERKHGFQYRFRDRHGLGSRSAAS